MMMMTTAAYPGGELQNIGQLFPAAQTVHHRFLLLRFYLKEKSLFWFFSEEIVGFVAALAKASLYCCCFKEWWSCRYSCCCWRNTNHFCTNYYHHNNYNITWKHIHFVPSRNIINFCTYHDHHNNNNPSSWCPAVQRKERRSLPTGFTTLTTSRNSRSFPFSSPPFWFPECNQLASELVPLHRLEDSDARTVWRHRHTQLKVRICFIFLVLYYCMLLLFGNIVCVFCICFCEVLLSVFHFQFLGLKCFFLYEISCPLYTSIPTYLTDWLSD